MRSASKHAQLFLSRCTRHSSFALGNFKGSREVVLCSLPPTQFFTSIRTLKTKKRKNRQIKNEAGNAANAEKEQNTKTDESNQNDSFVDPTVKPNDFDSVKSVDDLFQKDSEKILGGRIFDPETSLLTRTRHEKLIKAGVDLPLDIPYKLRNSPTWCCFDPTVNIGINNVVNPTFRLIFEDPNTGKLRRVRYSSTVETKGFFLEAGVRVGTTYATKAFSAYPVVYSSLPQVLTISGGMSISLFFAQFDFIQVYEYPDHSFLSTSAGFSFGIGYGKIVGGKLELNEKNNVFEKARSVPGFLWLTSVCGPIINFFWLICFLTVSSSPLIPLLFD